jgi:hypothetical protein
VSTLNAADIGDKSHSDAVTKIFALVQCTWLIVHSIARAVQGLAISQLELSTMAFIVCAVVMYAFWWDKPFNVERRHVLLRIRWDNAERRQVLLRIRWDSVDDYWSAVDKFRLPGLLFHGLGGHIAAFDGRPSETGPYDEGRGITRLFFPDKLENLARDWHVVALYVTGLLFSAVHLAAWNWHFPSPLIQALWRWSAVTALVLSLFPWYTVLFIFQPLKWARKWWRWIDRWENILTRSSIFIMFIGYTGARLIILSLSFYCFTSMPASTYERVVWTGFIPHFGS